VRSSPDHSGQELQLGLGEVCSRMSSSDSSRFGTVDGSGLERRCSSGQPSLVFCQLPHWLTVNASKLRHASVGPRLSGR